MESTGGDGRCRFSRTTNSIEQSHSAACYDSDDSQHVSAQRHSESDRLLASTRAAGQFRHEQTGSPVDKNIPRESLASQVLFPNSENVPDSQLSQYQSEVNDEGEIDTTNAPASSPSTISNTTKAVQSSSSSPQVAIKILVSNNASGSIIGRSGKTISQLQSSSLARIKLSQNGDYYPGTTDRVCLIQGFLTNAKAAVEMVLLKLYELQSLQHLQPQITKNTPSMLPDTSGDAYSGELISASFIVRLLVPTPCCGMLIGRGGSNIKLLKEQSGVSYIQLSPKEQEVSGGTSAVAAAAILSSTSERIMTITGPDFACCLKCVNIILTDMATSPEICRYINMTTSYTKAISAAQSSLSVSQSAPIFSKVLEAVSQQHEMNDQTGRHSAPLSVARPNQDQNLTRSVFGALPIDAECSPQQNQSVRLIQQRNQESSTMSRSGSGRFDTFSHGDIPLPITGSSSTIMASHAIGQRLLSPPYRNSQLLIDPQVPSQPSSLIFSQYQNTSVGQTVQFWSPGISPSTGGNDANNSMLSHSSGSLSPIRQLTQHFQVQAQIQNPSVMSPSAVASPQPVTYQFGVPDMVVGSILGRGGKTLTELQAMSKTRIRISQRGEFVPGTKNRIVTVTGPTSQSVSAAQYFINQRLTSSALQSAVALEELNSEESRRTTQGLHGLVATQSAPTSGSLSEVDQSLSSLRDETRPTSLEMTPTGGVEVNDVSSAENSPDLPASPEGQSST